jgi:hypothetical protein
VAARPAPRPVAATPRQVRAESRIRRAIANRASAPVPERPRQVNQRVRADFAAAVEARSQQIAERLLQERLADLRRVNTGRVYTRFDDLNDIVANQKEIVTRGLFSDGKGVLWEFYTSSIQTAAQKEYYYEIWNSSSYDCGAEPQFSVTWGHRDGSGSDFRGNDSDSPTRAIYSQYRLLLLEPDDNTFTFANNTDGKQIYVINFNRARIRQKLDPGNFEIWMNELSGSGHANFAHTGSAVELKPNGTTLKVIDDSGDTNEECRELLHKVYIKTVLTILFITD